MNTHRKSVARIAAVLTAGSLGSIVVPVLANADTVTLDKNVSVTGQGSTFVSNFMEQCKADSKNIFGINIAYQPTGSGAGRAAYINGTNDFVGSDVAFAAAETEGANKRPYVYIPVAIGGIAVAYKVPGVTDLKFSANTLAKIFEGKILKWNDEAIARENPGVTLPGDVIRVIVRSDSSGTSNVFSDYLATAGRGAWTKGATNSFPVPAGNGIAQRGSDGVGNYLAGDQGNFGIGYMETSFAEERKLSVAKIVNTAGNAVAPTAAGVTEAMAAAAINDDGSLLLNFNAGTPKAYPISTTAYLIVPKTIDAAKGNVIRTFLTYALTGCQAKAEKIGYAALPATLAKLGLAAVAKINPGSGDVPLAPDAAAPATPATSPVTPTTTAAAAATASTVKSPATTAPATTKPKATKTTKRTVVTKKK